MFSQYNIMKYEKSEILNYMNSNTEAPIKCEDQYENCDILFVCFRIYLFFL